MKADLRVDFIIRLLISTGMMAAAGWYLGSLWNARMRDQNLILIFPVVVAMVPFYLWVVIFEVRRFYRLSADVAAGPAPKVPRPLEHMYFMGIAVATVVAFYLFGAIPATLGALIGGLLVLGVRNPAILVLLPIGTTVVLWLVFIVGFGVRMPLFLWPW